MSDKRIGRYILDVLVSQTGVVELWQGFDPALERPVSLRLIPAQDELAAAAEVAARQAATVDDRRVIAVLDILTAEAVVGAEGPSAATYLVIVSEWVDGRTLTDIYEEREGEPIEIDEAVPVIRQVAIALKHSHELDVPHGRLRPGSLLIAETADFDDPFTLLGDTNVVRIRGLAVDAALWPADRQDDIVGLGSLLYAMLTGRWPLGLVDGMSPAPRVGERHGDGAGAGAKIQRAAGFGQPLEAELDQQLGLVAWNQHVRCHLEGQAIELALAGQVGNRLALHAPHEQRADFGHLLGR